MDKQVGPTSAVQTRNSPLAVMSKIPSGFIAAATRGLRSVFGPNSTIRDAPQRPVSAPQAVEPTFDQPYAWMDPGKPVRPIPMPNNDLVGLRFAYQPGVNNLQQGRSLEGVTFETLRNLAENFDLLRLAIQTRKDQLRKLGWSIQPKVKPGERRRPVKDEKLIARCTALQECMLRPDGDLTWDQWISAIADDAFVLDGVCLYRRRHPDGRPYALEIIDPATIQPLLDVTGRKPLHPSPAYVQIRNGTVVNHYTRNELTYWARNVRSNKIYGMSEVEQVVRTATLGIARVTKQVGHYSEGNIPDMLLSTPQNWTPQQIRDFQGIFDQLMSMPGSKRRGWFVPAGTGQPIMLNQEAQLFGPFDEWLARIICYAFSLPPFPFVKETNRATAETQYDAAMAEGLGPFLTGFKNIMDIEIREFWEEDGLELVWDDSENLSAAEKTAREQSDMRSGIISIDDIRAQRGLDPVGLPPMIFGLGPMGFMTLDQVKQAIDVGTNLPPAPMAFDAAAGDDPLAGAPPELLAQLGIQSPAAPGQAGGAGPGGPMGNGAGPRGPARSMGALGAALSRTKPVPGVSELLQRAGGY
ncbi:hypothetical protein EOD42_14020 [Rhodovarius crocodyli]|uniref:Phage portal protein n=1 Tax=Rhodovarius crocodyli TaxID=1979269 RepID=A0A437MF31_9PROT|nr:phage portal protein [Rhodovarius crocodyli]RVT96226.1 hypothetical protein EOD42_14020 [Rhodovarius crocodyli]